MKLHKTKNFVSLILSKYPRAFALIKSIYLLNKQYQRQLFYVDAPPHKRKKRSSSENRIAIQKFRSNFSRKKKTSEVIFTQELFDLRELNGMKIDICIPVYNHFDLVHPLMNEIKKQTELLKRKYNCEFSVLIADDHSTFRNQRELEYACKDLGFSYLFNEQNLGVVGNVNSAYALMQGDIFLLFNSDAEIGKNTLASMVKPILHDSKVALVTAPNLEMINRHLKLSHTWLDIADYLETSSQGSVSYVDACTAVSYAIAVRRSATERNPLMDPVYGMGYGEDSDLHYQLISRGWKSVWTLDTLVSHFGGASFGQDITADEYRKSGRDIFFKRWGDVYLSEIDAYEEVLQKSITSRLRTLKTREEKISLLVTPSDKPYIGGLFLVRALVSKIVAERTAIQLIILDEAYARNFYDLLQTSTEKVRWENINEVILIGFGSVRWFIRQNLSLENLKVKFFIQGPDWVIDPTGVAELNWLRAHKAEFIVTGDLTKRIALQLNPSEQPSIMSPNLDGVRYSGYEELTKDYDLLFSLRSEYGKGAHLAESLISYLSDHCTIHVVSDQPLNVDSSNLTVTRRTDPGSFHKKIARARVYVDTSLYEGFGLVPRQAGLLNTKAMIFPFAGATADLLKFTKHFQPLGDPYDLISNVEKILDFLNSGTCLGCEYCANL